MLRRIDVLFAEKRKANEKLAKIHADLDCELVAQQSREGILDLLWKVF